MLKKSLAILTLAATAACATPAHRVTADTSCLAFKAISYAQLPAGTVDDPGNVADSAATVGEIETHNARFDALCK